MPVTDQTTSNSSTGNGVTTVYPYTFKILDQNDLLVEVDGVAKTLTTHYTVSGVGNSGGGNVTFTSPPALDAVVVVSRSMAYSRDTDYQENGDLRAATLDEDVDRVTMLIQQVRQLIRRAVKLPAGVVSDQVLSTGNTVAERASKLIGFDSYGNPILYTTSDIDPSLISAFAATLLDDGDAAAARETLGVGTSDFLLAAGNVIVFEGTTDNGFEATLSGGDPTADVALTLPNKSGTIATTSDAASVGVNDFVLTLETGVPFSTSDQLAKTTIYCTPCKGNQIALYDGSSTWNVRSSAEFYLALGTLTASLPYDVFCYDAAGTPTLEFLAWTSATARATALVMQDGVLVKSGATTRRYLGTFYTASTTTTADAEATRYLWNYYNRVEKKLSGTVSVDRSIASATYVEVNAEVQIKYVIGVAEEPMHFMAGGTILSSTANTRVTTGITIDSTSVAQAGLEGTTPQGTANSGFPMVVNGYVTPAVGYHYSTLIGMSESATSVSYIAATTVLKSKVYLTAVGKR